MRAHEEYNIEETVFEGSFSPGRADWIEEPGEGIEHTLRLWPHLIRGEGHYIAKLRKRGTLLQEAENNTASGKQESAKKHTVSDGPSWKISGDKKLCKLVEAFLREELGISDAWMERHPGQITKFGDQIYLVPEEMISLTGIKVLRPGLHLLTEKKNRFEPAHALAGTLTKEDVAKRLELTEAEAVSYLRGKVCTAGRREGLRFSFMGHMRLVLERLRAGR